MSKSNQWARHRVGRFYEQCVFPALAIVRKGADAEVLARPLPFRHAAGKPILAIGRPAKYGTAHAFCKGERLQLNVNNCSKHIRKESNMSTRHHNNSPELQPRGRDEHFSAGHDGEQLRHAKIAEQAYNRWQQRGCPEGTADEDWFEAERQYEPCELVSAA